MEISDRDIERVENLFFPEGGDFKDENNERYNFIKCLDQSIDLHACPGSGKTTSLLAKLYLLSEKMPFEDGRAICVLTHTNVAIDTIKNRLGSKADKLIKYPNFFGTIQSFVDRFLAIPAFIKLFGHRPFQIDNDFTNRRLTKEYYDQLSFEDRKWFYAKAMNSGKGGKDPGLTFLIENIRFKFNEDGSITYINGLEWDNVLLRNPKTDTFKKVNKVKEIVLKDGAISFDDAYSLSRWYLLIHHNLKQIFSNRFRYIFIDEMQDTYINQLEIINTIFDDSVFVQRIGDLNQSILAGNSEEGVWEKTGDHLVITGSRRFSNEISEILKCVAIEPNENLNGFFDSGIDPYIITYDKNDIEDVIEKFVRISLHHDLGKKSSDSGNPIKAIGWRGTESDALTIGNYFPDFKKNISTKRSGYPNFISLIAYNLDAEPKQFKDAILVGLIEAIYLDGITFTENERESKVTKTKFLKCLKGLEKQLFCKISEIYKKRKSEKISILLDIINTCLFSDIFPRFGLEVNNNGLEYLVDNEIKEVSISESVKSNIYKSVKPDLNSLSVELSTVHNVKGETHTATLYLETEFNNKTCGEYLINQLIGEPYDGYGKKGNSNRDMCMKVAHVGFSRPTDLLCVAINRELVGHHDKELKVFGWQII